MTEEADKQAHQAEANEQPQQTEVNPRVVPMYNPDLDAMEVSYKHASVWTDDSHGSAESEAREAIRTEGSE